jgi:hypothetical protein
MWSKTRASLCHLYSVKAFENACFWPIKHEEEDKSVVQKPFMALHQLHFDGGSMKAEISLLTLLIACLLAGIALAQNDDRFQSISGDLGRSIISSLTANETEVEDSENNSNSTLWNWGTIPKGGMLVNGTLARDPFNVPGPIENPDSSYSRAGVDAFTGRAIYSYTPPGGAAVKYFYVDPYSGLPVYVERDDVTFEGSGSAPSESGSYELPPAFR